MKKLVIATLLLIVLASSVISIAVVQALTREGFRVTSDAGPHPLRHFEITGLQPPGRANLLVMQAPAERPQAPQPAAVPGQRRGANPPEAPEAPTPRRVPASPPRVEPPPLEPEPSDVFDEPYYRARNAFRLGQDLVVGPDEIVRDAAVIFGNARIAGRVTGNLVVIFGTANIANTAVIDGDFVSVGGGSKVEPGAAAGRDVIVIGGPLDAPAGFHSGGQQVVIGSGMLGGSLDAVAPYLSRGVLWGRIIVPDLPWVWGVVALFFLIYAALNLIFDRPVLACATTLQTRPLTAFGTGLLVLLLIGPVCLLLAISVIGIAVIPFVICALIAGGIIGKVAISRWIGMTAVPEDPDGNRAHAARSFVIGFAVLSIAYTIPVIGIISWAIAGVLGLGSAALTFMAAYRRENPAKPPAVAPPIPPAPLSPTYPPDVTAAPADGAAFDGSAAGTPLAPPPSEATAPPSPTMPYAGYAAAAALPAVGLLVAQPRAQFRDRLAAFVLDLILVAIAVSFLDSINIIIDGDNAFIPVLLVYLIGFWTWKQTSVGGIICQLRLVRTDGSRLTFADALVRGLSGIFSLAVLAIGALWILRDPERQAWHDKIAGTYVVKVPRNWPL